MNNKGQALVEFVLILPVFLFIVMIVYDFGMIFNSRNQLLSNSNDIVIMIKNGEDIDDVRSKYSDIKIDKTYDGKYTKIVIEDTVKLNTPGLKNIMGNPYVINVERYIPNE